MNDQKGNTNTNTKSLLSKIHSSILDLYSYLKMDKIQIVSKIKNNNHSLNYSYVKTDLFQTLPKTLQIFF